MRFYFIYKNVYICNVKGANATYTRKGLAILLLSLIIAISINNSVYLHSHIIDESGTIITHAHPFEKSADDLPFKKHSHTSSEYTITNGFENFLVSNIVTLNFITTIKKIQFYQFKEKIFKLSPKKTHLRGPPAFIL